MVIYDEESVAAYSLKIKRGLWLVFLPLGFALLFCIFLCFFIKEDKSNANFIHIMNVIISTLAGWFSLSVFLGYVLPYTKKRKMTKRLLSFAKKQVRGTVKAMEHSLTVQKGIKVLEIQINCDNNILSLYYDEQMGAPHFRVGDNLQVTIANNFVFAYEVESREEEI